MRDRIAKHVHSNDWMLEKSTYYILDAQGNCMNVYEHEVDAQDVLFSLKERHIYGSSTLGIYDDSVNMYTTTPSNLLSTTLGKKFYQMSDHRGNVNTVISDIKTPISTGTTVDYYEAYIVNIADHSGFGVELDGRTMKSEFYRRGFQNQEVDSEIKGEGNSVNYKYRMHDPRVGRFFAVDPLAGKYPFYSPYSFSGNRVIDAVELEGLEPIVLNEQIIGYKVKEGQGPTQIATDINNPETQKNYKYKMVSGKVDWKDIVINNSKYFPENIALDKNDLTYERLNLNEGDIVFIPGYSEAYNILRFAGNLYKEQMNKSTELMKTYEKELNKLEDKMLGLKNEVIELDKQMKDAMTGTLDGQKITDYQQTLVEGSTFGSILRRTFQAMEIADEIDVLSKKIEFQKERYESAFYRSRDNEQKIKKMERNGD